MARKRAQQRVKDVRRGVTRQDKRTEASEGSRWRAAAVRREQAYERRRAGVGLKQAGGGGGEAGDGGGSGTDPGAVRQMSGLEGLIREQVMAAPLQEVERLLRLVGTPPPTLGQGGKATRQQLLLDVICNGQAAGFHPSRGVPFAASTLWSAIETTYSTDHERLKHQGRSRRKRVARARPGVAAPAAEVSTPTTPNDQCKGVSDTLVGIQRALHGNSAKPPLQSGGTDMGSRLEHYTTKERRSAFQRDFATHRPPGPERSRRLTAAGKRHSVEQGAEKWWSNVSQATEGERGGVHVPPPLAVTSGVGDGAGRPRSAGVRRAQARRASVIRGQQKTNAAQFNAKTGRVEAAEANLDLTPRWRNAFEDENLKAMNNVRFYLFCVFYDLHRAP